MSRPIYHAQDFDLREIVFIGGTRRAVVLLLHPDEDAVTVQAGNSREKVPANRIVKAHKCCGGGR